MIIWDGEKDIRLKIERNISFEDTVDIISHNQYLDIIEHPTKKNQNVFVVELNNYIYAVPFVIDTDLNIILKTVYPSRKLYKKYRGGKKCGKKKN